MSDYSTKYWKQLKEIREAYLNSKDPIRNYWSTEALVEAYDSTFAQRIGWKWDEVLNKLHSKVEFKKPISIDDWGCGSGIASRKFYQLFSDVITKVTPMDRSEKAVSYANKKLRELGYKAKDEKAEKALLISHVLTELSSADKSKLVDSLKSYSMFIWLEPGTKKESHSLIEIRNKYLEEFDFILPCPNSSNCPLTGSEDDWCHFFAEPPREIFHSAFWKEFNKYFSIDLRSLPLSFLIAVRKDKKDLIEVTDKSNNPRILGRVRTQKGFVTYQACNSEAEAPYKRLQKRF